MKSLALVTFMALASAASLASAQESHRELNAHEHGVSTIEIAIEGERIALNVQSPGADIVGFEYMAEKEADKSAVESAILRFTRTHELFVFDSPAGCRVAEVFVHLQGGEHDHEESGERAGHTEFHASYVFECSHPDALVAIEFPFFDVFPNVLEIEAQIVTESGASAAEIGRDVPRLSLR